MTDDLISRADAMAYPLSWEHYDKEHGSRKFISGVESYREYIEHLPSAQPKRGGWIPCTKSGLPLTELMRREGQKWYGYRCSSCNHIYKGNALTDCNFCPYCGAQMKGADDE